MPDAPALKQALCSACKRQFTYMPRYLFGEETLTPVDCPDCEEADIAVRKRIAAESERVQREIVWPKLRLPFSTPETETIIAKLPHPRSAAVLRWQFGPHAPFLSGPSGQGKSRTMVVLLRRLWIEGGREFRFESWPSWQNRLEASHRFGGSGKYREIKPLKEAPILALDDVAKGKVTEHIVTAFFEVVDFRCSRGLPTMMTTKYSMTKVAGSPLEMRLAEGSPDTARDIVRRLCECSMNYPFTP